MRLLRGIATATALAVCLAAAPPHAAAHEIPGDITVHAFVKPEGSQLHLIVRVPLRAMRDVSFPTTGPGYLDLARADETIRRAALLWLAGSIDLYEGDTRVAAPELLAARVSLPSDRSFGSYDAARAHVIAPRLADAERLMWDAALLDVLFTYPIRSDGSEFAARLDFRRLALRVVTVLRFVTREGTVRAFEYTGDPGLVRFDPRWPQAAWTFVTLGCRHILEGADHLLFVFCLVIPLRRIRSLIVVITSFTAAHSITLLAAAAGLTPSGLWFPPLVEALIAASIVYMALENIVRGWRGPLHPAKRSPSRGTIGPAPGGVAGVTVARRWPIAFAFGLVHGFGFSFALRETLQFAGSHLLVSLLAFNAGVELGQLLALALMIPAIALLFRYGLDERVGTIILSALVAHTAWHWMADRIERLRQFGWPALDAALLANAMRIAMVMLAIAGAIWLARGLPGKRLRPERGAQPPSESERGWGPASIDK